MFNQVNLLTVEDKFKEDFIAFYAIFKKLMNNELEELKLGCFRKFNMAFYIANSLTKSGIVRDFIKNVSDTFSLLIKNNHNEGIKIFIYALNHNTSLRTLDLSESDLFQEEFNDIFISLLKNNHPLTSLILCKNFSLMRLNVLRDLLRENKSLKMLDLRDTGIHSLEDLQNLAEALRQNTSLTTLYLDRQYFIDLIHRPSSIKSLWWDEDSALDKLFEQINGYLLRNKEEELTVKNGTTENKSVPHCSMM